MSDMLTCSRCGEERERPISLKTSTFAQCEFVCEDCRCSDCGIVLGVECECGERHAEISTQNSDICADCMRIRERIASLQDKDILNIRKVEIARQEPIYGAIMPKSSSNRPDDDVYEAVAVTENETTK